MTPLMQLKYAFYLALVADEGKRPRNLANSSCVTGMCVLKNLLSLLEQLCNNSMLNWSTRYAVRTFSMKDLCLASGVIELVLVSTACEPVVSR